LTLFAHGMGSSLKILRNVRSSFFDALYLAFAPDFATQIVAGPVRSDDGIAAGARPRRTSLPR